MGEKLFGFRLVDSSALLLFIMSVSILFMGFIELYVIVEYYNASGTIPVGYFLVFIITMSIGLYILYKTITYRKKPTRNK